MDKRDNVISKLEILRTWCAVNPIHGMGLGIDDCDTAVEWLDAALELLKAQEKEIAFLKQMQRQITQCIDNQALGDMVSRAVKWDG